MKQLSRYIFILFLATKTDLRDNPEAATLTPEDGKKLKRKIKADAYVECSALRAVGLDNVFETAVRVATKKKQNTTRSCVLL